jgi:hypothetical protein
MNIIQIKQLQTVDGWIDCNAQIKEVKEIKQRTKSNLSKTPGQKYNVQKLIIQDDTDTIGLWAYANQQFTQGQIVSIHGMVKEYQNKRYLDYCDIKTDTNTHQDNQQASQNRSQSTKAPQTGNNDVGIRRSVVCAYLASGSRPLAEDVEYWMEYIKTGKDASLPDNRTTENQPEDYRRPAQDDDVPF